MGSERELLDVTDRTRRPLQHGAVFAGVLVLLLAKVVGSRPGGIALTLWMMAAGFALFVVAAVIKQRWTVTYEGHEVRYENNPFTGEKLFIDHQRAGKGKVGYRSEMRGVIAGGDGAGDTIIARTEAGLLTLHCRITALEPEATGGVPPAISDEQLLAEVRRRGLGCSTGSRT
ncbi:MAG TPA: hypothetical protein VN700_12460 [Vicinamibacterales bacterium]|nr:hypothetical protein [Vicinamibacterales bacterium]